MGRGGGSTFGWGIPNFGLFEVFLAQKLQIFAGLRCHKIAKKHNIRKVNPSPILLQALKGIFTQFLLQFKYFPETSYSFFRAKSKVLKKSEKMKKMHILFLRKSGHFCKNFQNFENQYKSPNYTTSHIGFFEAFLAQKLQILFIFGPHFSLLRPRGG